MKPMFNKLFGAKKKEPAVKKPASNGGSRFTQEQTQQLAMERTPRGYVWHHGMPGELQLVGSHIHRQTGHSAGYCIWPQKSAEEAAAELAEERRKAAEKPNEPVMWGFVEPLEDPGLIAEFERQEQIVFPESYVQRVLQFNGAYPSRDSFLTEAGTLADMKCLLSFNKRSSDSIWVFPDYADPAYRDLYTVFAENSNGNYICFRKQDLSIVYIDHETQKVEAVAPDFDAFLQMLY